MTKNYKVKKVTIYPGMSMKMHCHEHRSESWTVVDGIASIQIGDVIKEYCKGATVSVPVEFHTRFLIMEVKMLLL